MKILKKSGKLSEINSGVPSHVDYDSLQDDLKNINNVYTIHDLHIWSLSLNRLALSVHIVIGNFTLNLLLLFLILIFDKVFIIEFIQMIQLKQ